MIPPSGFEPIHRVSPVSELIGPIYMRGKGRELELGLLAQAKHGNSRGFVHGGILAALADLALGYTLAFSAEQPAHLVTASLTIDYAGTAKVGDWLTTRTEVLRHGSKLAFANCYISAGEQRIVRASGIFSVVGASISEVKPA